jgi:hypothetical protein
MGVFNFKLQPLYSRVGPTVGLDILGMYTTIFSHSSEYTILADPASHSSGLLSRLVIRVPTYLLYAI